MDHAEMLAKGGSSDIGNLRVVHAVCNLATANGYPSMVALVNARQIRAPSFRVEAGGLPSAHEGRDIDVAASFRAGKLIRCKPSRSPLVRLFRWLNAAAVDQALATAARRASALDLPADLP